MKKSPVKKDKENLAVAVIAKAFENKVRPLLKWDGKIKTQQDFTKAETVLYKVKELIRAADKKEKEITAPLTQSIKKVRELFHPFQNMVKKWENQTKAEMVAYLNRQETKIEKVSQDFEDGKIKKAETVFAKQDALVVDREHTKVRRVPTVKVVDFGKIPAEFLVINEVKIREALLRGEVVPGCELVYEKSIAI